MDLKESMATAIAATDAAIEGGSRTRRKAHESGAPVIEYSYRKDKGRHLTVALTNGTAIDITAEQIARMIELSVGRPAKRKAKP